MPWDSDDSDPFEGLHDLIPEDAIPEAGLRIVSYVSPGDGKVRWAYKSAGATEHMPGVVGLIEMAKIHFLTGHDGNNEHASEGEG